jgi:hypothetical protein
MLRKSLLMLLICGFALCQTSVTPRTGTLEGQDATILSNGRLELTVLTQGAGIASLVMTDKAERFSPLWNPIRLARETGRSDYQFTGMFGHFPCVDGFGQPSAEERAAGLPQHGEAHVTKFKVTQDQGSNSFTLSATFPIVQETFTRTFRMVPGENVVYVDSQLENLLGFDRPVNWAEHATVSAPYVAAGKMMVFQSGMRSQNRPAAAGQAGQTGRGGAPATTANQGRGNAPGNGRPLESGKDFTWPMAPGANGITVDMSSIPDNVPAGDHTTTLLDPTRRLEWLATLNTEKGLIYGYVIRREDYPWIQHWGNYPSLPGLVRGLEFGTQPYDVSRREVISKNSMFDTLMYRWLPAKSKIESHFVIFYARVPEGFRKVDEVTLEHGQITVEDRTNGKQITFVASRGL